MKKLIFTALLAICVGAVAQTTGKLLKVIKNDDTEVTYRLADLEDVSGIVFLEVEVPFDTTSVDTIPTDTLPHEICDGDVDLGLPSGTKWAACNVGASLPADKGDIFAWGEPYTRPDTEYSWRTYKYCNSALNITKYYLAQDEHGMTGIADGLYMLDRWDDAASVKMNTYYHAWHMPTEKQIEELINNCKWEWTTRIDSDGNEVEGYLIISLLNRNAMFLPISVKDDLGGCYYWSKQLSHRYDSHAISLRIRSGHIYVDDRPRYLGYPVRGVYDSQKEK